MTPAQFHSRLKRGAPPATLLLGPEAYERRRIKEAMIAALPPDAITQHDLAEIGLAEVIDDARALSLFASERLIWVTNAELVLPRGKAASAEEVDGEPGGPVGSGDGDPLGELQR